MEFSETEIYKGVLRRVIFEGFFEAASQLIFLTLYFTVWIAFYERQYQVIKNYIGGHKTQSRM